MRSLPFIEADSVRASLKSRQVIFRTKKDHAFDLKTATKALQDAGYPGVELVSEPKG